MIFVAGIAGGVLVTGKFSPSDNTYASPQVAPQAAKPAAGIAAGAALPDLSSIAEDAIKAAVNISSTQVIRQRVDPFYQFYFGDGRNYTERQAQSLGSGVVVSPDGYILTNSHVLLGEGGGKVSEVKVSLPGKEEMVAKIIGVDTLTDLAVLKVDGKDMHTLPWGDSSKVRIAEWVLAIGNPFQFNQTVTLGIVSAIGRGQLGTYAQMIQTDAAINPGNSGGLLINARGELIGINSMIYTRTGGSEGLGFAIPANLAQRIMKELIANGAVRWGTIDVAFEDVGVNQRVARQYGINSQTVVMVTDYASGSTAARAGLRRQDVILSMNGQPVADAGEFERTLADKKPGTTVELEIFRDGKRLKVSVPVTNTQDAARVR